MEQRTELSYEAVLEDIKKKLKGKRGYGPRIAEQFQISKFDVYNVLKGKARNKPEVLQALVDEATQKDPNQEIINRYLQATA